MKRCLLLLVAIAICSCELFFPKRSDEKKITVAGPLQIGTSIFVFPPDSGLSATIPKGDFSGVVLSMDNGEVAGFISESPPLADETSSMQVLSNSIDTLTSSLTATIAVITSSQREGGNTVTSHYAVVVPPTTTTELGNTILEAIGLETQTGSVSGLPLSDAYAPTDTDFRLVITVVHKKYSYAKFLNDFHFFTKAVYLVAEKKYLEHQALIDEMSDGTNSYVAGAERETKSDVFTAQQTGKADFLFVVDNSGSMGGEQTAVSHAGDAFYSKISASGTDFRVGVITTDSDVLRGSFTAIPTTFKADLIVGTSGSSTETGIYFAERALFATAFGDSFDGTVTQVGYPRTDSTLSIIILSDEASQYDSRAGHGFSIANNLFVSRGYRVYSIVDPYDADASQYDDLAVATGGMIANINDVSTFEHIMNQIAVDASGSSSSYVLTATPLSSTIVVSNNGVEVRKGTTDGWQYVASSNSVVFYGSSRPTSGTTVKIYYECIEPTTSGSGQIAGRVYVDKTPTVNALVKVYYEHSTTSGFLDEGLLIAETFVSDGASFADDGYYSFDGLPTNTNLIVMAVEPTFLAYPAVVDGVLLEPEREKQVILTISLPVVN